jgi:hypothetical protein
LRATKEQKKKRKVRRETWRELVADAGDFSGKNNELEKW